MVVPCTYVRTYTAPHGSTMYCSRKHWHGFKLGSLVVFRNTAKFNSLPTCISGCRVYQDQVHTQFTYSLLLWLIPSSPRLTNACDCSLDWRHKLSELDVLFHCIGYSHSEWRRLKQDAIGCLHFSNTNLHTVRTRWIRASWMGSPTFAGLLHPVRTVHFTQAAILTGQS